MSTAINILDTARIDYTTPFMKLWLAFNAWYKDMYVLKNFNHDSQYIEEIKDPNSRVCHHFKHFLENNNDYKKSVAEFYHCLVSNILKDKKNKPVFNYNTYDDNSFCICSLEINWKPKIPGLYEIEKDFLYYDKNRGDEFFAYTFEMIYMVRNNLMHVNTDIHSKYFESIIKSSYEILLPILEKIIGKN